MMHLYMKLSDDTEITHSQIIKKDDKQFVEVHFERPKVGGFDTARCTIPSYEWSIKEGYSAAEIDYFEEFLKHNAHLIFKYAECGGVFCA